MPSIDTLNCLKCIWLKLFQYILFIFPDKHVEILHHVSVTDLSQMLQHLISYQLSRLEGQVDYQILFFFHPLFSWSVQCKIFQLPRLLLPPFPMQPFDVLLHVSTEESNCSVSLFIVSKYLTGMARYDPHAQALEDNSFDWRCIVCHDIPHVNLVSTIWVKTRYVWMETKGKRNQVALLTKTRS